jgi:hypothetical protein
MGLEDLTDPTDCPQGAEAARAATVCQDSSYSEGVVPGFG